MNNFAKTLALAAVALFIHAMPASAGCTGCDTEIQDWTLEGYLDARADTGFSQYFDAGQRVYASVNGYDGYGGRVDMDFEIWQNGRQIAKADLVGDQGLYFYTEANADYYVVVQNASYYGGHWELYFETTTYR